MFHFQANWLIKATYCHKTIPQKLNLTLGQARSFNSFYDTGCALKQFLNYCFTELINPRLTSPSFFNYY